MGATVQGLLGQLRIAGVTQRDPGGGGTMIELDEVAVEIPGRPAPDL